MLKHKILDFALFILIVAAGVFFFRFVRGNIALEQKVQQQALQANSLIEEVGQTKEENRILYEKFQQAQVQLDSLKNKTGEFVAETAPAPSVEEISKVPRPKILPELPQTTNFLVVGQHKKLADTIMIAAANTASQKITLISLPRDLVVNGRKVN